MSPTASNTVRADRFASPSKSQGWGLSGRVEDGGRGRVAVRENVDPAEGGMGLKLVDSFIDRWGVEEGTTNVWFEVAPRRLAG